MVDQIEQKLIDSRWLGGDEPGEADKEAMKVDSGRYDIGRFSCVGL